MKGIIYMYTCPKGKHYVGQTINEAARKSGHKHSKYNTKFSREIQRIGYDTFKYEVLERVEADTEEELKIKLNKLECDYIYKYNIYYDGYNYNVCDTGHKNYTWEEHQKLIRDTPCEFGIEMIYNDNVDLEN